MNKHLITFVVLCTPAHAAPWEDVIPAVSEQAAHYLAEAERRFEIQWNDSDIAADVPYQGSFEATVGSDSAYAYVKQDHECGILGRMLGVADLIKDQERINAPDITDDMAVDDIGVLWGAGRSYELWVAQATRLVAQDLDERVQYWNNECRSLDLIPNAPLFIVSSGPSYEDFPAESDLRDDHPIPEIDTEGWSDWAIERSLPRIQGALEQGPNFAGRYSVVLQSCGGSCAYYDFIDIETGQSSSPPLGGERTPELALDFNKYSQLVYAIYMQSSDSCLLQAWSYDGEEFRMEHEQTFERMRDAGCRTWNFRVVAE